MLHVDMQGVNKWFSDLHVLQDITLGVERAGRIVICGASGSGSTPSVASTGSRPIRVAGSSSTASR